MPVTQPIESARQPDRQSGHLPGPLRVGLLADVHYADLPPTPTRDTRASLRRVRQAIATLAEETVDLAVSLGDLIHTGHDEPSERRDLQDVAAELHALPHPVYHCLGNHCVDRLAKAGVLRALRQPAATFDVECKGVRLLGLDTCFNPDGSPYGLGNGDWRHAVLPEADLAALDRTLDRVRRPTLLFCHHRLDTADDRALRNAPAVRAVLDRHAHVLLVVQGHAHVHAFQTVGRHRYLTLAPVISPRPDANACAILERRGHARLRLIGLFDQPSIPDLVGVAGQGRR